MADVNTPSRKRKLSAQESVIEITDDDDSVEISSLSADVEIVEPDAKVAHFDMVQSQSSDSNLEFGCLNSQSSVDVEAEALSQESVSEEVEILHQESVNDVKQRLLELDDEVRLLRAENEELRSKSCSCKRPQSTEQETVLSITFSSNENFRLYKDKLIKLFSLSPELCVTVEESNLLIDIAKDTEIDPSEWVILDEDDVKRIPTSLAGTSPKKKKKKAKSVTPVPDDLFMLDTTPSLSTKSNNLFYESKFTVLNASDNNDKDKQIDSKTNISTCFNCNENHNLRDCPKPKNFGKISAARQKFKSHQVRTVRYHLDDDQRFAHLQPGKMSEKLQRALGLRHNELPPYIYRMRQMGYPPGWFNEIQTAHQSELVMFDFEGKSEFKRKKQMEELDAERIIEYPGFNAPLEKGVKDEYRLYGCPAYSKDVSKQSMLAFIHGIKKKAEDNLEACDMDIDNPPSDKEVEAVKPPKNPEPQVKSPAPQDKPRSVSPTLGELESAKQKLLAALTQDTSNSCPPEELEITRENDESVGEAFCTIDITGTVDELNDTTVENKEGDTSSLIVELDKTATMEDQEVNGDPCSPAVNLVKTSSFGTPILKSASPYCRLPNPDNFMQNVSQVINFENLPNATGKYDQMVGVIEKVRKTLKNLNDQKS